MSEWNGIGNSKTHTYRADEDNKAELEVMGEDTISEKGSLLT